MYRLYGCKASPCGLAFNRNGCESPREEGVSRIFSYPPRDYDDRKCVATTAQSVCEGWICLRGHIGTATPVPWRRGRKRGPEDFRESEREKRERERTSERLECGVREHVIIRDTTFFLLIKGSSEDGFAPRGSEASWNVRRV